MTTRVLVVDAERELRVWLRHHIEILWPDGSVQDLEPAQFDSEWDHFTQQHIDLILLGVQCGAPGDAAAAMETLHRLQKRPDMPPVIVIAHNGNELAAVRAMRLGAIDYLPRASLDAPNLGTALKQALRTPKRIKRGRSARAQRRRIDPAHLGLPQYALLHKLGESARAAVYLAHSSALGRNVALKISKPPAGVEDSREFEREYAALSALRHRSVVQIYDYGFHDGHEFIAMEYFPCGDLKTRLQHPITTLQSLQYAFRICDALQGVHAAGLVHRDLKPPNLMLREDGSVVLIDFGIAKSVDTSESRNTSAGVLRGSPYYMSPEQAQGLTLDARSDLYSVGVILYEMLTGTKPYVGSSAVEVMQQHVHGPRPKLPTECSMHEGLLERFMARTSAERFQDATSACVALATAIELSAPANQARQEERDTTPLAVGAP